MAQDIVISREQARNNQFCQRAKQQAVARGVCLRVQDAPQPKVPVGLSRDASGINLLASPETSQKFGKNEPIPMFFFVGDAGSVQL